MAEIHIEKKKSIWPWIIGALVAALLIWGLLEALDNDEPAGAAIVATEQAVEPVTGADAVVADQAVAPAGVDTAAGVTGSTGDLSRFAGTYASDSMQLALTSDGSYVLQESPAGEARGTWTYEAGANALKLTPADGSQDRYFRAESAGTLIPLNPNGEPAAQMAPLTLRDAQ